MSTGIDGQQVTSKDRKAIVKSNNSINNINSSELKSATVDKDKKSFNPALEKECGGNKICGQDKKEKSDCNTDPESPYSICLEHKNNSPSSSVEKPYSVSKRASDMPEMAIDALESLSDLNAVKDQ